MAETVSGRLPPELLRGLDRLGKASGRSRSDVLREVVERGLAAAMLEMGLEAYRRREVSLGRAAEMAGVPITSFIDELRRAGILRDFDAAELRRDLEWAREV
jgi:predicted DNA-binding protein